MATELKIPVPDQTTEEVRIVQWKKKEGDTVKREEIILEVESDKSVIEVESVADGVLLKQLFPVDEMVPVGEVVAYIGQAGEKLDIPDTAPSKAAATAPEAKAEASTPSTTSAAADGTKEIKIPIPDQTTEEVRIVKWRKAEGEAITKDEIVLEVETDKSVIEVEAIADGVLLKQLFAVDDMVPVGKVVGFIGAPGTKIDDVGAEQPAAATTSTIQESTTPPPTDERVKASPVAKKVAAKLGVNLGQVTGTGPQGRITREDVEKFVQTAPAAASAPATPVRAAGGRIFASPNAKRIAKELQVDLSQVPGSGPDGRILGKDVQQYAASKPAAAAAVTATAAPAAAVVMEPVNGQPQPGTVVALTKMRRAIGMNLQMSSRDTPHFNCTVAIDMTRAMEIRKQLNGARAIDKRVSVNDMIVRACAVALKQYPAVNCRLKGDELHYLADVNIGVATAVPDGLVVPVLTNAETRDWDDLSAQTKRLATEARKGKILGAGKGTFTVSNLGMFGVEHFTAIINPPESAILAVGGAKQEVVAIAGGIGIRPIMRVTLCSDHRLIDGALAAQFLQSVKKYLEEQVS